MKLFSVEWNTRLLCSCRRRFCLPHTEHRILHRKMSSDASANAIYWLTMERRIDKTVRLIELKWFRK